MSINAEPDWVIKAHDRDPSISAILEEWDATEGKYKAMDLSGIESVTVVLRKKDEPAASTITGSCEKEPGGVKGKVTHKWGKDDLKTVDDYDLEFKIVRKSGEETFQRTVPNEDYYWLRIEEDLDKA